MFSSANDRNIIAWAPGGGVHDRIGVSWCLNVFLLIKA